MVTTAPPTLAAAVSIVPALIWIGVFIAVLAVGGTILLVYRRKLFAAPPADHDSILRSLQRMRDSGEISPDEYDAARKSMAARVAGVPLPTPRAQLPDARVAPPGFDLTGAPLPPAATGPGDEPPPAPADK